MRLQLYTVVILALMAVLGSSCFDNGWGRRYQDKKPSAFVPIYGIDSSLRTIASASPQPTVAAGKIYTLGNRLYQVENSKGIHIIDYQDVNHPVKLAFITIPGCSEVTVRNNVLLTNNMNDLVSIDISDVSKAKLIARVPKAFNRYFFDQAVVARPAPSNVYYVCPDPWQGEVVGWKVEKNVEGAFCKTN